MISIISRQYLSLSALRRGQFYTYNSLIVTIPLVPCRSYNSKLKILIYYVQYQKHLKAIVFTIFPHKRSILLTITTVTGCNTCSIVIPFWLWFCLDVKRKITDLWDWNLQDGLMLRCDDGRLWLPCWWSYS